MDKRTTLILRIMLAALAVTFGLTLYAQSHRGYFSADARQYQQIVRGTMSGLSLWYLIQKICWLLGIIAGAVAIVLLFFRIRGGLFLLLSCAPLLMMAAASGAPPSAFPNIEPLPVLLLECLTSATWGCVVTYVLTERKVVFATAKANRNAG